MNSKKAKFFIALMSAIMLCLFTTAIVQTFVLKNLQNQNKEQNKLISELQQKDQQADRENEYYESEEYLEEYFRSQGNQKEDDIIFSE